MKVENGKFVPVFGAAGQAVGVLQQRPIPTVDNPTHVSFVGT